ncbi:SUKH-3 domain-containing protein [Streptomyces sp. NPDC021100]|uniref:SUKH-3 domain-containing protein n=1 Tax=Streptomyces sp. NPDC021100 TaxID=3365114 RepID=UPI0037BD3546
MPLTGSPPAGHRLADSRRRAPALPEQSEPWQRDDRPATTDRTDETELWLKAHGWYPGRDVGDALAGHVAERVRDFRDQGKELAPTRTAEAFLRTYGGLELPLADRVRLITEPDGGHVGIAEDVAKLAAHLGQRLFPVAYETYEGSVHLLDETDRFFLLHPSGTSYLGTGSREAFANRRRHALVDAWRLPARRPGTP